MRKVFILLFISLALLSCQKEENNRKTEYQVLTSKDASKPFSCLGEKRIITITIIKKTLTLIPQYYCKLNLLSRGCVKTLTHLF